jgi:hypothetical protein
VSQPDWPGWVARLQAIAQAGLELSEGVYDRERYLAVRALATEIAAAHLELALPAERLRLDDLLAGDGGYPTPKVDVRALVRRDGEVLLVGERADGRWVLPAAGTRRRWWSARSPRSPASRSRAGGQAAGPRDRSRVPAAAPTRAARATRTSQASGNVAASRPAGAGRAATPAASAGTGSGSATSTTSVPTPRPSPATTTPTMPGWA